MARILILSGMQLSTNPRVVKEASALADAGHDVEVAGALLDPDLAARDEQLAAGRSWKYTVLTDASSNGLRDRLRWQRLRVRRRLWRDAARIGVMSAKQVTYVAPEMLKYARSKAPDLTILHNAGALWVGTQLMREGCRIAVDMEDWYSEDVPEESAATNPVSLLREWESSVLRGAVYSTTPSESMAKALVERYGCDSPSVIHNSFSLDERQSIDGLSKDRKNSGIPSLCWFSQIVGPGRGLETLMESLHFCNAEFEVHLRGRVLNGYSETLLSLAPANWRERICFHSQVPHRELMSRVAEHDVGLAAELRTPMSRDLTITNKLPFYLLAGLGVIASDTIGQREAAELAPGAVFTFPVGNPTALAARLDEILGDTARIAQMRSQALAAASCTFSWERSREVLLTCVELACRSIT